MAGTGTDMGGLHEGRVALVTGGDSGIGRGVCEELAREGAAVVVADVGPLDAAEALVRELPRAIAVAMDVTDEGQVADGFARARDELGVVDLMVNNAGIEMPHALVDMPLSDWRKVLDVNLTGAFLCAREAARGMIAAARAGTIVNVSSVHEQIPWKRFSHYCASKGGMKLFAQTIANELAPHGIRVVNVAPGAIETPINRDVLADPAQREAVEREIALGRWGKPEDVGQAVSWVASERAAYVTGTTLFVDGGMTTFPNFI
jgi:glucose 1-dehydrogenase